MTAAEEAPLSRDAPAATGTLARVGVVAGTLLIIVALAALPLLTPPAIHPMLALGGSAERLGLATAHTQSLSDRSVEELLLGPGTFAFEGPDGQPFYDPSERAHLADARLLLWTFLVAGILSTLAIGLALLRAGPAARRSMWRSIAAAGATAAITVAALGVTSLVAFDTLFSLFHQVFFPAGNWAFDPSSQRLVQLYPFSFWRIAAAAFGGLVLALGFVTWTVGRAMAGERRRG